VITITQANRMMAALAPTAFETTRAIVIARARHRLRLIVQEKRMRFTARLN
jgi:hypothetical protein